MQQGAGSLLVLLLLAVPAPAVSWSIPGLPSSIPNVDDVADKWQELLLQSLWEQHRDSMSYCVGSSLADAKELFKESFPSPLPTGTLDDQLCSNSSLIMSHLCSPLEVKFYMKYLLLTDNPEKLPSSKWCDVGSANPSCTPGFFQARLPQRPDAAAGLPEPPVDKHHACCPGYICPSMLTCMLPCPMGAYCPRAWAADPPSNYLAAAAGSEDGGLLPPELQPPRAQDQPAADKWCAPYAYKMRPALGCGGGDKWTLEPNEPFPRRGDWWSGNVFCPGGRYCPNTTAMLDCQAGHFCKSGSSKMQECPPLLGCPPGTESPIDNKLGFALNAGLLLLLAITWQATQLYNSLMRRLSRRERMKIMWNSKTIAPEITVVEEDEVQLYAPPPTARQTTAGAFPSPSSGGAAPNAAAAAADHAAGHTSSWLGLSAKLGVLGRAQLFRRRSSRAGAGTSSGEGAMTWASFDEAPAGQYHAPLLQHDMLQPAEELSTVQHMHSAAPNTQSAAAGLTTQQQQQQQLPPLKSKQGRISLESQQGHDLISTGVYTTALSPSGLRGRLESEASSGARFFSGRGSRSLSGDGGSPGLGPDYAAGFDSKMPAHVQLDVAFEGLGLKLKSCGKVVLQGVSGRLEHGRLAAVMGPSGAGKTTLLTALAGRASYGILSGKVTINGRPDKLEKHKRLMGFVPQSDIMYRNLTVEENLTYSACFRLPACTTASQRMQVVAAAIDVLGLDDVRHQLIGNEEVRGISGGQVKRVNVGLELVAEPSLLFLDEPTSGLDSTASKLVVQCLQRVARSGVTVAAVIHQPSWETFCLFDDLVLLAKGGLTAYYGPQDGVQAYFEGLGFEIPGHMNPADAYMDIIAGIIKPATGAVDIVASWRLRQQGLGSSGSPLGVQHSSRMLQAAGTDDMLDTAGLGGYAEGDAAVVAIAASRRVSGQEVQTGKRWGRLIAAVLSLPHTVLLGVTLVVSYVHDCISGVRNAIAEQLRSWAEAIAASSSGQRQHNRAARVARASNRRQPGFIRQFLLVLKRAALMRTREPFLVFIEYMIFAVTGMFVGLMSDRGRGSMGSYVGNVVYTIVAMGMLATISGVKVYGGPDRLVFFREASTGLSKLAYFWALDTWSYMGMVLRCAVYLIMYYTYSQPRAIVWQLYVVTCAIYYSCQGQAFLLSQVMGANAAQLTAAVSALINALVASKFSTQGALGLMNTISYARWGLEGFVIAEANCLKGVWLLARCADLAAFSYDVTQFWYAIKVLVYIGLGSRLAACLAMLTLHRDKSL